MYLALYICIKLSQPRHVISKLPTASYHSRRQRPCGLGEKPLLHVPYLRARRGENNGCVNLGGLGTRGMSWLLAGIAGATPCREQCSCPRRLSGEEHSVYKARVFFQCGIRIRRLLFIAPYRYCSNQSKLSDLD
jgi:hypothetical protein